MCILVDKLMTVMLPYTRQLEHQSNTVWMTISMIVAMYMSERLTQLSIQRAVKIFNIPTFTDTMICLRQVAKVYDCSQQYG